MEIDEQIELDLALSTLRYSLTQIDEAIVKQKTSLSDWDLQQLEESQEKLDYLINLVK